MEHLASFLSLLLLFVATSLVAGISRAIPGGSVFSFHMRKTPVLSCSLEGHYLIVSE